MSKRFRAIAMPFGNVLVERFESGRWRPMTCLTAYDAETLGLSLCDAASQSRLSALRASARCHGRDCDDFPDCPCGGWERKNRRGDDANAAEAAS